MPFRYSSNRRGHKKTAQKDTIIDTTSDSQVKSELQHKVMYDTIFLVKPVTKIELSGLL